MNLVTSDSDQVTPSSTVCGFLWYYISCFRYCAVEGFVTWAKLRIVWGEHFVLIVVSSLFPVATVETYWRSHSLNKLVNATAYSLGCGLYGLLYKYVCLPQSEGACYVYLTQSKDTIVWLTEWLKNVVLLQVILFTLILTKNPAYVLSERHFWLHTKIIIIHSWLEMLAWHQDLTEFLGLLYDSTLYSRARPSASRMIFIKPEMFFCLCFAWAW